MQFTNDNGNANALFAGLAEALQLGMQQPRQYNGENKNFDRPVLSRFKMKIWYRDGNARTYFSFDHVKTSTGTHTDEFEGLKKLIRLGHVAHKENVKVLVIWANTTDMPLTASNDYNHEVLKVSYKGEQSNKFVKFRNDGKNTTLDFKLLATTNKKIG